MNYKPNVSFRGKTNVHIQIATIFLGRFFCAYSTISIINFDLIKDFVLQQYSWR